MSNPMDQFCSNIPAAEGFVKHPLGTYDAMITKVVQNNHNGKNYWAINLKTSEGVPPDYTIWDFDGADINRLQTDAKFREQVQRGIARDKFWIATALGIPVVNMKNCNWTQLLGLLGKLAGKFVNITVQEDQKNPKFNKTWINTNPPNQNDQYNQNNFGQTQNQVQPISQAPQSNIPVSNTQATQPQFAENNVAPISPSNQQGVPMNSVQASPPPSDIDAIPF